MLLAGVADDRSISATLTPYLPVIIVGLMCGLTVMTTVVIFIAWRKKGLIFHVI